VRTDVIARGVGRPRRRLRSGLSAAAAALSSRVEAGGSGRTDDPDLPTGAGTPPGGGGTTSASGTTDADTPTWSDTPEEGTEGSSSERFGGVDSAETIVTTADPGLDDDRLVVGMLRAEDGRLKQGEIVRLSDWSKAKVSRLLTRMAERGEITKIRLGRENLICLAGHEPPIAPTARDRPEGRFDPNTG
jgi:hypothetical protein